MILEQKTIITTEENHQNDVKVDASKEIKTDLKTTDESKTKIVWVYAIGGLIVAGLGFGVLRRFKLI